MLGKVQSSGDDTDILEIAKLAHEKSKIIGTRFTQQ